LGLPFRWHRENLLQTPNRLKQLSRPNLLIVPRRGRNALLKFRHHCVLGCDGTASASLTTHANGTIASISLANNGDDFRTTPTVSITTSTGSGAQISAELGGFITLPENIIGAINIFPTGSAIGLNDMFNVNYQLAMSDMYNYTNFTLIPYYITRTHLSLIEQLLSGQKPVRYNRNRNRFYIDMSWNAFPADNYVIIEAYEIVDPDVYQDVWKDRWLIKYSTALIKRQWGNNLKKFSGLQMPGGVMFNGQIIYDEAEAEIQRLEQEMLDMTLPPMDMIG
jgi:hypothetical protein